VLKSNIIYFLPSWIFYHLGLPIIYLFPQPSLIRETNPLLTLKLMRNK